MRKPFDYRASSFLPEEQAPIAISVEVHPDSARRTMEEDFIPNPTVKQSKNTRKSPVSRPVLLESAEFRDHATQKKLDKKRNQRTLDLAKQIYEAKRDEIAAYEQSAKIVNSATQKQLANPTVELGEAMVVYERGRPMSKKRAIERAKKEVQGQERVSELMSEDE